ncbi:unnamed protein product [Adineta ricciae]|uniref:PiggyBac transposable element-derived protein domain-containing protein n=1 Tax=Adineta ricciae TaxID=249248 RepID=A0A815EHG7_ADIRI|nr:unnamed protein product [Adineta ricciae]CAF1467621.1 unnamed protein product [Adineta ricciae]
MDSDFEEYSSDDDSSITTSDERDTSDSEDIDSDGDNSLTDELNQVSIHEWKWDTANTMFTSSFNYFDGSALGNNIVRPIDAFNEYISQDIIELIVNQTNVYGQQRCVEKGKNATDWKEIDSTQIYSFMGILLIMGFHKLPRIRDYWSNDRNLFTPAVANVMTRAEFQ